jgi:hypothetical protein
MGFEQQKLLSENNPADPIKPAAKPPETAAKPVTKAISYPPGQVVERAAQPQTTPVKPAIEQPAAPQSPAPVKAVANPATPRPAESSSVQTIGSVLENSAAAKVADIPAEKVLEKATKSAERQKPAEKAVPKMKSFRRAPFLVLGIAAGLLAGYAIFEKQLALAPGGDLSSGAATSASSTKGDLPIQNLLRGSAKLEMDGQIPGDTVIVKRVVMDAPGWVAVADDTAGKPGRILGAYYLPAGTYERQMVPLLRALADGASYFAVIWNDDGDKTFDLRKDSPRAEAESGQIVSAFSVGAKSTRGE